MEVLVVVPALLPPLASTSPSPRSRPILRALQRQQLVSLSDSAVAHLEELRELQERWRSDWNRAAASKAGTGGRLSFVLDWNEIDRRRVFVFERCWPTGSHGSGVQDHIQGLGIGARRATASTADFKTPRTRCMGWGVQLSTTGRCSTSCLLARVSIDIAGAGRGRCRDYAAVTRLPKLTKASPARWTCRNSMIFLCRFVASVSSKFVLMNCLGGGKASNAWYILLQEIAYMFVCVPIHYAWSAR